MVNNMNILGKATATYAQAEAWVKSIKSSPSVKMSNFFSITDTSFPISLPDIRCKANDMVLHLLQSQGSVLPYHKNGYLCCRISEGRNGD